MQIIIDVPENPTNCDVIKALFPYVNVKDECKIYYSVNIEDLQEDEDFNTVGFRKEWMDAPWKGVEQESKTGHCKNCKYFEYDSLAKVDGVTLIVAHEICKKWGGGCKTSEYGYCFMFESKESEDKE